MPAWATSLLRESTRFARLLTPGLNAQLPGAAELPECYDAGVRFESFLSETLDELRVASLLREPDNGAARREVTQAAGRSGFALLDASSNDYLGFASRFVSRETVGNLGAGASRLIHGSAEEHHRLEAELADWVHAESALLFSSTYAANLGLISALGISGSVVLSDARNHASIIDGARLAKADVRVLPHLDLQALASALRESRGARSCWVVTESYFSMDGDGPDLPAMRALCDSYDACLIVDEAHALGVFGPSGAGRCAQLGVKPDILVGALGKAVGSHGGFVCGSHQLRTYLWNRARSFVFSTAPSPWLAEQTRAHVQLTRSAEALRATLEQRARDLRAKLHAAGLPLAHDSFGPIVSVILGENRRVLAAARQLQNVGILAQAIRPPTVPAGGGRLRLTVKATFSAEDIDRLAEAVIRACES